MLALAMSVHERRRSGSDRRTALVTGAIVWGTALVVITEGLSAFELLDRTNVAIAWVVFLAVVLLPSRFHQRPGLQAAGVPQPTLSSITDSLSRAQIAAIALLVLTAVVLSALAAPSAADAMTYHLPRIEHWIQNSSVAPFRSNIQRELWTDPGAEYILLHLEILSGIDRGSTLLQSVAYAADIIVASLLARQLGASRRGQIFAAFLAATTPGAVAQATGSQVELVFAFWLACVISLGLRLRDADTETRGVGASILFGLAIGLAILTKATAYLYLAPFMIWFLVASVRRSGPGAARRWLFSAAAALAMIAPHYYHNTVLYANPLGQPGAYSIVNAKFFVEGTVSNVIRNLSLHFGTPFENVNAAAESAVVRLDARLGIAPDDARTTFPGERYRFRGRQSAEQTAGSPIHVLIGLATCGFLILARRNRHRDQLVYILCIGGGFLLFSFFLRWQPWHARLHVPLLILVAPAAGFVMEKIRRRTAVWAVSGLALASCLPPLLRNPSRPLIGPGAVYTIPRERQYFAEAPQLYPVYRAAADHLQSLGCSNIGLWLPGDGIEYPLWALLRAGTRKVVRIRHVSIDNASAGLDRTPPGDNFTPCALVFINSEGRHKPVEVPDGYDITWRQDIVRIYTPSAKPGANARESAPSVVHNFQ